ncbi:MAG: hypothetical protein ACKN9T_07290 [Candidatus Methylumidiphilus sp.]
MTTLKRFSEKDRDYHAYQARQNYLREQRTIQWEREQDREKLKHLAQVEETLRQKEQDLTRAEQDLTRVEQDLTQEKQQKELALRQAQAAQAEIERLQALLAAKD